MGWVIAIIIAVFLGAWWMWTAADLQDAAKCREKYGQEYLLGHSSSNSSIKWCQAPNGEMKAL